MLYSKLSKLEKNYISIILTPQPTLHSWVLIWSWCQGDEGWGSLRAIFKASTSSQLVGMCGAWIDLEIPARFVPFHKDASILEYTALIRTANLSTGIPAWKNVSGRWLSVGGKSQHDFHNPRYMNMSIVGSIVFISSEPRWNHERLTFKEFLSLYLRFEKM